MLGPPKARNLDRPVLISLDAVVPKDHFYRHLERTLDLAFVRDLVTDCYASGGRPSIDPVVFFKLHLIMFFEGLRSERKLIEIASLNLAHRCGCPLGQSGYHLDESLPDHSSLSTIRARLGLPVFRRFFETIVVQCANAGLVRGEELIFDATNLPRGRPARTPRWIRSRRYCVSSWTIISPHSHPWRHLRKCRAGICLSSVASIPIVRKPLAVDARAISV